MSEKLSDAERHIMEQFWQNGAMRSDEVAKLVKDKGWKPTTLLTFLSRLAAKGMLNVEKDGRANRYTPLVGQAQYKEAEARAFLDEQYGGSARDFIAALVDSRGLSQKDIAELRRWLAELGGDELDA